MEASSRRASHIYLERLQKAAYARLGHVPPTYDAQELLRRTEVGLDCLREGGEYDAALEQRGLAGSIRHTFLQTWRQGLAQMSSHQNMQRILEEYRDAPTPHVDPHDHAVLKRLRQDFERLWTRFPRLMSEPQFRNLNDRITLSTLPTGQVNARVFPVAGTDEYLILFDPAYFSFIYNVSIAVADAIDGDKASDGARRYAESGQEADLGEALHKRPDAALTLFDTLFAFLRWGLPPPPRPYDEKGFSLAEHLRDTGTLFVAAHEYAHILLGHIANAADAHGGPNPAGPAKWEQEIEADWLACALLDAALIERRLPRPVRFMGVHFFFLEFHDRGTGLHGSPIGPISPLGGPYPGGCRATAERHASFGRHQVRLRQSMAGGEVFPL